MSLVGIAMSTFAATSFKSKLLILGCILKFVVFSFLKKMNDYMVASTSLKKIGEIVSETLSGSFIEELGLAGVIVHGD